MINVTILRKNVKKYIETVDEQLVKMVHARRQAYSKIDLWDGLPSTVQQDVQEAIKQSAQGKGKPHDEVMRKYNELLTK